MCVQKEVIGATPVETFNEGTVYWFGLGRHKDYVRACDLFEKSASQNYKEAQYNLGNCYRLGKGRANDLDRALYWYKKSADNGYISAKIAFLAVVITEIKDKTRYYKKVHEYINGLLNSNNAIAQFQIGLAYFYGVGVEKNVKIAIDYYEKSAKLGNPIAQGLLSYIYRNGLFGIKKDLVRSGYWKERLEDNSETRDGKPWTLEYVLAYLYTKNIGVRPDSALAREYREKSDQMGSKAHESGK